MKIKFNLTQPQRLASLIVDLCIVLAACLFLFDIFYPPIGEKGFWAYSALLAILVGSKLVTPFYVKPVDAISYAVPAFVTMMLINDWGSWSVNQKWGFSLATGYGLVIFGLGILNIVINTIRKDWASNLSNKVRVVLEYFGQPQFIYTPIILYFIFSYHSDSFLEGVIICIVLGVTVWWSLSEFLIGVYYRLKTHFLTSSDLKVVAQIAAFQEPDIILLKKMHELDVDRHDVLIINDRLGLAKLVVVLDEVGRSDGILIRTVHLKDVSSDLNKYINNFPYTDCAYKLDKATLLQICENEGVNLEQQANLIGLVNEGSEIGQVYFEVISGVGLEEGRLVSIKVGNDDVLYQVIDGLAQEDVVQQKNTFGFLRAKVQQIGVWVDSESKFKSCNWLPNINTPVYLVNAEDQSFDANSIGHFPKTNFHVSIKNIDHLVTHNTAVLGILGVGKSMLSVELAERMLVHGIKVLVVDLTDEYKNLLNDFYINLFHNEIISGIEEIASRSKGNVSQHVEDGGGVKEFKQYMDKKVEEFVDHGDINLLIINPSDFEVWRQDSKPYEGNASMASLTPTEITQIISESALSTLRKKGKSEDSKARLCLVYEEAHSLVPEWNSVVNEGDKNATNGTARAILQGRKYGLGCLLITQRTANVTKTILNQCNTVFAMRTFDETGKSFLSNYLGKTYADTLSTLPERHAVFFGKASSCNNPVMLRLNDQLDFRRAFRKKYPIPIIKLPQEVVTTTTDISTSVDEDIPF